MNVHKTKENSVIRIVNKDSNHKTNFKDNVCKKETNSTLKNKKTKDSYFWIVCWADKGSKLRFFSLHVREEKAVRGII